MSILIRTVRRRRYAYEVRREGRRVRHIYIGRVGGAGVARRIASLREADAVPERFHRFFWDADPRRIHLRRHKTYVIERILELGNFSAFLWLSRVYPGHLIRRVNEEARGVSERSRNFWRLWFE